MITDLGPVVFDRWIDFIVHVRWQDDATGVLQCWVNGSQKVDETRKTWGGGGVMTSVKPTFGAARRPHGDVDVLRRRLQDRYGLLHGRSLNGSPGGSR